LYINSPALKALSRRQFFNLAKDTLIIPHQDRYMCTALLQLQANQQLCPIMLRPPINLRPLNTISQFNQLRRLNNK
jgi:hypothetical protein